MNVNLRLSSCNVQTKLENQPGQGIRSTFCICVIDDGGFDFALGVSGSPLSSTQWMQSLDGVQVERFDGEE